jgi:UDP-glucuronate 4-epimerase
MILVTGVAGFIGFHVARQLLARGEPVLGVDNLNSYYDPALKRARLVQLEGQAGFRFAQIDLTDALATQRLFARNAIQRIVHLAAQAGVRYSMMFPQVCIDSNVTGFINILEQARAHPVEHLVYASSSSVYGANQQQPFSVADRVDQPVSLYAATKRANELMAHVYALQFNVPATGLRFFTVYGPWGRPDMAAIKFSRAILAGEPIDVYNNGDLQRDFSYIDDVADAVLRVLAQAPPADASGARHRLYNVGNEKPEPLLRFIEVLAAALGRTPQMRMLPMQAGDVHATFADIEELRQDFGWSPTTSIDSGLPQFVKWYRAYYGC